MADANKDMFDVSPCHVLWSEIRARTWLRDRYSRKMTEETGLLNDTNSKGGHLLVILNIWTNE